MIDKKIKDYYVCMGFGVSDLRKEVKEMIEKGWALYGGLLVGAYTQGTMVAFYQPMVMYNTSETEQNIKDVELSDTDLERIYKALDSHIEMLIRSPQHHDSDKTKIEALKRLKTRIYNIKSKAP